jgi:hypothetical protein
MAGPRTLPPLTYTGILARTEIAIQVRSTDPPADVVVHTVWHLYPTAWAAGPTEWQSHADAVRDCFFHGTGVGTHQFGFYGSRLITVKAYDMADIKPRPEKAVSVHTPGTWEVAALGPRRLASCLSYYCVRNIKRQRGRLFIGPFVQTQCGETFDIPSFGPAILDLGHALSGVGSTASAHWVLHSPTDGVVRTITNIWCNDLWDSIDSREHTELARSVSTVPP